MTSHCGTKFVIGVTLPIPEGIEALGVITGVPGGNKLGSYGGWLSVPKPGNK